MKIKENFKGEIIVITKYKVLLQENTKLSILQSPAIPTLGAESGGLQSIQGQQ